MVTEFEAGRRSKIEIVDGATPLQAIDFLLTTSSYDTSTKDFVRTPVRICDTPVRRWGTRVRTR